MSTEVATGVNILKARFINLICGLPSAAVVDAFLLSAQAGSDPKLGKDEDYPDWLWGAGPQQSMSPFRAHEAGSWTATS